MISVFKNSPKNQILQSSLHFRFPRYLSTRTPSSLGFKLVQSSPVSNQSFVLKYPQLENCLFPKRTIATQLCKNDSKLINDFQRSSSTLRKTESKRANELILRRGFTSFLDSMKSSSAYFFLRLPSLAERWNRHHISMLRWGNFTLFLIVCATIILVLFKLNVRQVIRDWDKLDELSHLHFFTLLNWAMSVESFFLGSVQTPELFIFVLGQLNNSQRTVREFAILILQKASANVGIVRFLIEKVNWTQILEDLSQRNDFASIEGLLDLFCEFSSARRCEAALYGPVERHLPEWLEDPFLRTSTLGLLALLTTDYRVAQLLNPVVISKISRLFQTKIAESDITPEQAHIQFLSTIILSNLVKNQRTFEELKEYPNDSINLLQSFPNRPRVFFSPKIDLFLSDFAKLSMFAAVWGGLRWLTTKKPAIRAQRLDLVRRDAKIMAFIKESVLCGFSTFIMLSGWKIFQESIHFRACLSEETRPLSLLNSAKYALFSPVFYVCCRLISPFAMFPTFGVIGATWFVYYLNHFEVPSQNVLNSLIQLRKERAEQAETSS